MSFSATLYRVSQPVFNQLETGAISSRELVATSKDFVTVQDSGDAILFILKKRSNKNGAAFIDEIFSPTEKIGGVSDEDFQKLIESCNYKEIDRITASTRYFLSPHKIATLNSFFDTLDSTEIDMLYDAAELNSKNIYPSQWSKGEDNQRAYNLSHVKGDLESLTKLFKNANTEKDYILVFTG